MNEMDLAAGGGALFAVAVGGFLVRWLTKLVDNHLTHLHDAVQATTSAVEKMGAAIEKMADSVERLTEELRRRP